MHRLYWIQRYWIQHYWYWPLLFLFLNHLGSRWSLRVQEVDRVAAHIAVESYSRRHQQVAAQRLPHRSHARSRSSARAPVTLRRSRHYEDALVLASQAWAASWGVRFRAEHR